MIRRSERWLSENTLVFGDLRLLRSGDKGNFVIIGVPGSGKTTSLLIFLKSLLGVIPPDLDVMNAFVYDPKNDFYRALLSMELPLPVILTNVLDSRAWGWNMHADVKEPVDAAAFAEQTLQDDKGEGKSQFYNDSPKHRLASTLREFVRLGVPWSLRQAYLITMDDFYARQLYEKSGDPQVRDSLKFMNPDAKETWANISMSLVTKLQNLATYAALLDNVPENRRYSIKKMVRNEAIMVFGGDFKYGHILGPMTSLVLKVLKNELVSQENEGEPGSNTRRHWVVVDEFPKLNQHSPVEEFGDFCEVGRSKGVRVCIVIHTPQQLVKLYGREGADILLGLCQHKLIFRVGDYAGAEYCSHYLGWHHGYEWTRNVSRSSTSGSNPSSTTGDGSTEQRIDRVRVHADAIMDLPLGDWKQGLHYYGIAPSPTGTMRWRGHIRPDFINQHVVVPDASVPSYESCRRGGREQSLRPLGPEEVAMFGLQFDPNGYRP